MSANELRAVARQRLSGQWGNAVVVSLIFVVINGLLSTTGFGLFLLGGPLAVGLASVFLSLNRSGCADAENLLDGIRINVVSSIVAYILQAFYIFLWSLLFVIPGIVKSYSYAMTYYILRDNPGISASEAIGRSRLMMRGHKLELFFLQLSFLGWILLSILTCGIGFLLVRPYMQTAQAAFYDRVRGACNC